MAMTNESNRKKFSNWIQGVNSLHVTKLALHEYVLETWMKKLDSWDKSLRDEIPRFLQCVAGDKIKVVNDKTTNKKQNGTGKRNWDCVCGHSSCKQILAEKILTLQRNPGFNIIWNSNICQNLLKDDIQSGQLEEEDGTENIPRAENGGSVYGFSFIREWITWIKSSIQNHPGKVEYEDIFKGCKQKHIWCIANMFMQRGKAKTNIPNTGPEDTDASMFFKMMKNCTLFDIENENYIYDDVILCRDRLHHSANNRLSQKEAETHLKTMIGLLKKYENVPKCKDAITNIEKMLQETVMSLAVKNESIKFVKEALKMKETALKVDIEMNAAKCIDDDEKKGLLNDTGKDLKKVSESQTEASLYDGMKSREDYKKENEQIAGNKQEVRKLEEEIKALKHVKKKMTKQTEIPTFSESKDGKAKEYVTKLADILTTAKANPKLYAAITEDLIPALEQAAEADDELKEKVNEASTQEEDEQNSEDVENSSPVSDTQEENIEKRSTDTEGLDQENEDINSGSTQQHYIGETGDSTGLRYLTCCRISPSEIMLADRKNKKLKKLDDRFNVIQVLNLEEWSFDICYLGNNECVVALEKNKLQFVDVRDDMKLTRSVGINHDCCGLAYQGDQLYVIDDKSVYLYTNDGLMQRCLYTHKCNKPQFRHIALSDDSSKVYIACLKNGLVTVDSAGNCTNTFLDPELKDTWGVCVDDEGLVMISSSRSPDILQISSDENQKVGKIENKLEGEMNTVALYFDKQNGLLITSGTSGNITVLTLKKTPEI